MISGRYYAMDRDKNWDRVKKAYDALTLGEGKEGDKCPVCTIAKSYEEGITDEFVVPTVMKENGQPVAKVSDHDSVVFFNFRPDRARSGRIC